ncbi:MAG: LysR family transcriptional regulator [Pseudomonadota bacterium]
MSGRRDKGREGLTLAPNLKQIEAFVAVADLASFRRAADRLNTTQPNISARISAMEGLLGFRLMDRDAGSVRLTPKGEALMPAARQVLSSVDNLVAAAGDDRLFTGVIRLGVTEMIAHTWLGAFLKALQARFPNVLVELSVDLSVNVGDALFRRGIDLALQNGPFERQASGQLALGAYPMVWVAAPELGAKGRLSLNDLTAMTILTHAKGAPQHDELIAHLAEHDMTDARLATSTNLAACQQMTMDGLGVACLPRPMAAEALASGRLVEVDYPWIPKDLEFAARYDADLAPSYVRAAAQIAVETAAAFRE